MVRWPRRLCWLLPLKFVILRVERISSLIQTVAHGQDLLVPRLPELGVEPIMQSRESRKVLGATRCLLRSDDVGKGCHRYLSTRHVQPYRTPDEVVVPFCTAGMQADIEVTG